MSAGLTAGQAENKELNQFTEQMAQAHTRLTAGVQELQEKQKKMVPRERLDEVTLPSGPLPLPLLLLLPSH